MQSNLFKKFLFAERFADKITAPGRQNRFPVFLKRISRDRNDGNQGIRKFPDSGFVISDAFHCLVSVHNRHAHIHENQMGRCVFPQFHSFQTIDCLSHLKSGFAYQTGQQITVIRIVFDYENAVIRLFRGKSDDPAMLRFFRHFCLLRLYRPNMKTKGAAFSCLTLDKYVSAHEFNVFFADGQPQTCSFCMLSAALGLSERLKQQVHFIRSNARAAIFHLNRQKGIFFTVSDAHCDMPMRGEFDGIAQEIEKDLPEFFFISVYEIGNFGNSFKPEFYAFFSGTESVHAFQQIQQLMQIEILLAQIHISGFNFGHFQHFIDEFQQMLSASDDSAEFFLL